MNIVDFLIDNFYWLILIIVIAIITVIGFLADKKKDDIPKEKKNKKKKGSTDTTSGEALQYQEPLQMVQNPMEQQNNTIQMNQTLNPMNIQPQSIMPQMNQPIQNHVNTINNPQPVENLGINVQPEPMQQPIMEQPMNIGMQPNMPQPMMQNATIPTPIPEPVQPVNVISNLNNIVQPLPQQPQIQELPVQQMPNLNQTPNLMPIQNNFQQPIMEQPTNIGMQPNIPQPMMTEQPINMTMPNFNNQTPNMMPIQNNFQQPMMEQPINIMPQQNIPQPMIPTENINQGIAQSEPMIQSQNQPPIQNPQFTAQPINFVYGNSNNNQNM